MFWLAILFACGDPAPIASTPVDPTVDLKTEEESVSGGGPSESESEPPAIFPRRAAAVCPPQKATMHNLHSAAQPAQS